MGEKSSEPGAERKNQFLPWVCAAAVGLVTFLVFHPVLENDFVNWDDPLVLLDNPHYRGLRWSNLRWMFTTLYAHQYHPLTWLSYAVDYQLWGLDSARGYHLTSLCLHVLNAVVCFFLARNLLVLAHGGVPGDTLRAAPIGILPGAAVAALFFALHPLRVETVAWATERRGVLCASFYLLSVLAYLKSKSGPVSAAGHRPGHASIWFVLSVAFAAAALLSKSMAVSLPFVLLILDAYPLRRLGGTVGWRSAAARRVWVEKIPFFLIAIAGFIIAPVAQGHVIKPLTERGVTTRLATIAYNLVFYWRQTLFPLHLSPFYQYRHDLSPFSARYVTSAVAVLAVSGFLWARRRRWPAGWASGLAYGAMAAPIIGIVSFGRHIAADRYTYLPCLPIALLGGALLCWSWRRYAGRLAGRLVLAVLLVAVACLGLMSYEQTGIWRNARRLWGHALRYDPGAREAHGLHGNALLERKYYRAAIADLTRALAISPDYVGVLINRGMAYREVGEYDRARQDLDHALAREPNHPVAHLVRGNVLDDMGDRAGAMEHYNRAIALHPTYPEAFYNRGLAYFRMGNLERAIADYTRAIELFSGYTSAFFNRGVAYYRQGDFARAIDDYTEVLRRCPDDADAYLNRALAYCRQGDYDKAWQDIRACRQLGREVPDKVVEMLWRVSGRRE